MKLHTMLLILIAACLCWFGVEYYRFRLDAIDTSIPLDNTGIYAPNTPDQEPGGEHPEVQQRSELQERLEEVRTQNRRIREEQEDARKRRWIANELELADFPPSDGLVNLFMLVSAELGMTAYDQIGKQIELFVEMTQNGQRISDWSSALEDSTAEADDLIVDDIKASLEVLKEAFPEFADAFEAFEGDDFKEASVLYAIIAEDMGLTFEEMQFFWRVSILTPTMIGAIARAADAL